MVTTYRKVPVKSFAPHGTGKRCGAIYNFGLDRMGSEVWMQKSMLGCVLALSLWSVRFGRSS